VLQPTRPKPYTSRDEFTRLSILTVAGTLPAGEQRSSDRSATFLTIFATILRFPRPLSVYGIVSDFCKY